MQQLVARIKRTSRYAGQAPKTDGGWFDIEIAGPAGSHGCIEGNGNYYQHRDVNFGVRLADGSIAALGMR